MERVRTSKYIVNPVMRSFFPIKGGETIHVPIERAEEWDDAMEECSQEETDMENIYGPKHATWDTGLMDSICDDFRFAGAAEAEAHNEALEA